MLARSIAGPSNSARAQAILLLSGSATGGRHRLVKVVEREEDGFWNGGICVQYRGKPWFLHNGKIMLHTWVLICLATTTPRAVDCNMFTASKWFQVADQPSKEEKVIWLTKGVYIKIIQFPIGKSLGTDSYIYYPCETPKTELEKAAREIGGEAGSSALRELGKGDCLR